MQKCESCGNECPRTFQVVINGQEHFFDSFECAINALAPTCQNCQTRVIGHGVERGEQIFCGARCAEVYGVKGLRDHLD